MQPRYSRIQRVLFIALGVNLALAVAKLFLGWKLGSLAVISDGFHSVLDGAGSAIGLVAIFIAAQPPDARHPYGHRKFEVLATLILCGLLLLSCWEILGSAVARLRNPVEAPLFSWWAVLFLIGTMGINYSLSVYEKDKSHELDSPLLAADAMHTRSDFFTTALALVGIFTAWLGLYWLDAVAAICIALIIGRAAYLIIRDGIDTVAEARRLDPAEVRRVAENVAGVQNAHDIRSHGMSNDIHLDLHMRVDKRMSAREVFDVEQRLTEALKKRFPGITEVSIRHEPSDIRRDED